MELSLKVMGSGVAAITATRKRERILVAFFSQNPLTETEQWFVRNTTVAKDRLRVLSDWWSGTTIGQKP